MLFEQKKSSSGLLGVMVSKRQDDLIRATYLIVSPWGEAKTNTGTVWGAVLARDATSYAVRLGFPVRPPSEVIALFATVEGAALFAMDNCEGRPLFFQDDAGTDEVSRHALASLIQDIAYIVDQSADLH
jgi:hypothetical protein